MRTHLLAHYKVGVFATTWLAVLVIMLIPLQASGGADVLVVQRATLNLTETMYNEGAGAVKETDWLDNKIMVESLRSIVAMLEKNELLAQAARAYISGYSLTASTGRRGQTG